jgi:hypothetical protein
MNLKSHFTKGKRVTLYAMHLTQFEALYFCYECEATLLNVSKSVLIIE